MEVEIFKAKCQGYGNCVDEAPDVFTLDAAGFVELIGDEPVPAGLEAGVHSAVLSCPAQALRAHN